MAEHRPATNAPLEDSGDVRDPSTQIWAPCAGYLGGVVWEAPEHPAEGVVSGAARSGRCRGEGVPSPISVLDPAPALWHRMLAWTKACSDQCLWPSSRKHRGLYGK